MTTKRRLEILAEQLIEAAKTNDYNAFKKVFAIPSTWYAIRRLCLSALWHRFDRLPIRDQYYYDLAKIGLVNYWTLLSMRAACARKNNEAYECFFGLRSAIDQEAL